MTTVLVNIKHSLIVVFLCFIGAGINSDVIETLRVLIVTPLGVGSKGFSVLNSLDYVIIRCSLVFQFSLEYTTTIVMRLYKCDRTWSSVSLYRVRNSKSLITILTVNLI